MAWEKSFDEDEIVGKAMQVFWDKGYQASSINDLISATGINRGSLYNAFGGKLKLFAKALIKYDKESRGTMLAELEALNNPRESIRLCFDRIIEETVNDEQSKGCFVINTSLELPYHDQEIKDIVVNGLREFEAFFQRGIEVAQVRSEMPKSINPSGTAKVLMGLIISIRVLGRGVLVESDLRLIANEAERLIN